MTDQFEITINAALLESAMSRSIAGKRSSIQIYEHALLESNGDELGITSTDSVRTLVLKVPCSGRGTVTADSSQLLSALNGLREDVRIELNGALRMSQGRRRFNLRSLPPQDFPLAPRHESVPLPVNPVRFGEALRAVAYAIPRQSVDANLLGAFVDNDYIVATDRYRLAITPLEQHAGQSFIVPRDSVDLVAELAEKNGSVSLLRSSKDAPLSRIEVTTPHASMQSLLLEGPFLAWRSVAKQFQLLDKLPKDREHTATFSAKSLLLAISRVMSFMQNGAKAVTSVRLKFEDNTLRIAPNFDTDTIDEIQCEASKAFETALSVDYLKGVLLAAESDNITIGTEGIMNVFKCDESPTLHAVAGVR